VGKEPADKSKSHKVNKKKLVVGAIIIAIAVLMCLGLGLSAFVRRYRPKHHYANLVGKGKGRITETTDVFKAEFRDMDGYKLGGTRAHGVGLNPSSARSVARTCRQTGRMGTIVQAILMLRTLHTAEPRNMAIKEQATMRPSRRMGSRLRHLSGTARKGGQGSKQSNC